MSNRARTLLERDRSWPESTRSIESSSDVLNPRVLTPRRQQVAHTTREYLTNDTLNLRISLESKGQQYASHLPHAANHASGNENVLHYGCNAVWGRGRRKGKSCDAVTKVLVSPTLARWRGGWPSGSEACSDRGRRWLIRLQPNTFAKL
jgi:hypothetical protein